MRKAALILILCASSFLPSYAQQAPESFKLDDKGITVENFDTSNHDDNRYNQNNTIYTVGRKFTYAYSYTAKNGNKAWMAKSTSGNPEDGGWQFAKQGQEDSTTINHIVLKVIPGLSPFIQMMPDYNQTIILYDFIMRNGKAWNNEMTGVIENRMNVWAHPPRSGLFRMLELNPFPYIKAPYKVGTSWTWKLDIGDQWADKRWLIWKGSHQHAYTYKITGYKSISTKMGNLDCYIIDAKSESTLGQTKLTSYFNPKIGFIKLDYTNIDGSKMQMELIKSE